MTCEVIARRRAARHSRRRDDQSPKEAQMTEAQAIAEAYIDTWNAGDAAAREALLARHWRGDAVYQDPLAAVSGRAAIGALIDSARARFPGFRFALSKPASGYGDIARFSWTLGPDGAEAPIEGSDVLLMSQGRIARVIGFLDRGP
jgi:hypothetical protein